MTGKKVENCSKVAVASTVGSSNINTKSNKKELGFLSNTENYETYNASDIITTAEVIVAEELLNNEGCLLPNLYYFNGHPKNCEFVDGIKN